MRAKSKTKCDLALESKPNQEITNIEGNGQTMIFMAKAKQFTINTVTMSESLEMVKPMVMVISFM